MAVIFCNNFHSSVSGFTCTKPFSSTSASSSSSLPPSSISSTRRLSRPRISASASSSPMEFPYVSPPHRKLMLNLLSTVETRLGSQLLPSTLPPDVQSFQNQSGTSHGSLHIRSGHPSSPIDFMLGSWLHCNLPTGGELNITSLSVYLNSSTDAPNFLIELIRSSPTMLILILDLPPRKDLAFHPDYLKTFYEDTKLDAPRQSLEKVPELKPYFSTSLYIRSVVSPTAITVRIEADSGRLEEIIGQHLDPVAEEVMGVWLDQCACGNRQVEGAQKAHLLNRDKLIKSMTIEIDLGSNFPRLFGQEITDRVLGTIQEFFSK